MTRNGGRNRDQIEFTSLEELVPEDHLVRKLENAIDWSFIYELVEDSYCEDNGRPSLDPVILIKLAVIQFMFGIRSMRQTIQEIKVNMAYRWFLGLGLHDSVPHFSTFGKNYMRRFQKEYSIKQSRRPDSARWISARTLPSPGCGRSFQSPRPRSQRSSAPHWGRGSRRR